MAALPPQLNPPNYQRKTSRVSAGGQVRSVGPWADGGGFWLQMTSITRSSFKIARSTQQTLCPSTKYYTTKSQSVSIILVCHPSLLASRSHSPFSPLRTHQTHQTYNAHKSHETHETTRATQATQVTPETRGTPATQDAPAARDTRANTRPHRPPSPSVLP